MADTRHVKGLAELQKFLETLPVKLEQNIMRGALRAGAKVILQTAKQNIHNVSGELAASLRVTTRVRRGRVVASVVAGGKKAKIGNRPIWVEYGTRAHLISVQEEEKPINFRQSLRRGRIVRASMTTINRLVLKIGKRFVGPTVSHPGARPRPFMRPALDAQAGAATVAVGEYIKKRLTKEGLNVSGVRVEGDT